MIDENRPGILQTAILQHDNAPYHRAAQTMETIKRLSFELLDHPFMHQTCEDFFPIDQECFERYMI